MTGATGTATRKRRGRYSALYAYPLAVADWMMTFQRLKTIAIALPVVVVVIVELARYIAFGAVSWQKRLLLDLIVVGAIIVFSTIIFRFAGQMQLHLRRQNEELLALHTAGLAVAAELSLDVVLKKVVEQATELVGAKYGAVSVIGNDGQIANFVTTGINSEQRAAIGPPPTGHGLLGVVLNEGHHLRLKEISSDPRSQGFPANHPKMSSLLAVPIPCKGPFRGNLYLSEKLPPHEFTAADEETLERFALQAAIAIDNAYLHAQVADLAVAEERVRIAREMHDGLAQVLGYVNTKVQAANEYLRRGDSDEASVQLRELATSARQAYSDVRESIVGLRTLPSAERSLGDVLREYLEIWSQQSGITASFSFDDALRLRPGFELQLVRIVQEALTNSRKHAKASAVNVDIRQREGHLTATITDNGVGFRADALTRSTFPRFGLTTMRERAESIGGTLVIDAEPGRGTTVRFDLPLRETE